MPSRACNWVTERQQAEFKRSNTLKLTVLFSLL
jgi:hypothetical protein